MWPEGVRLSLLASALVPSSESVAIARDEIRVERIRFERGANSAVVEASLTGYEAVDHLVGARKGQRINVRMATDNTGNPFDILAPGENEVALFNGSIADNQYEGILPASGDYEVRVYLMRSAARRNEVANYRLELILSNVSDAPAPSGDALVPGTGFHAIGEIPCSRGAGQPTGSCPFGVRREGGGSGIVTVTQPDGRTRAIFFERGEATGADVSEADPGAFRARRGGDLTTVQIGDERYEIPDAVISGG